ncbi:MAG: FtsX-like permease family protein [Bacteroidetes bacterium]|nr:MAG: FtsX-like permease family protein [Bacteroidota bacterium]
MNLFSISFRYAKANLLSTLLNIFLLAFGLAMMLILLLVSHQIESKFTKNAQNINMVVGAKGSPLQLILSAIYHIDFPTGNISAEDANLIRKNPMIKKSIPLGLGDSYEGFRIVGTDTSYANLYECELSSGKFWEKPLEVTIGARVAERLNLKIGDSFKGAHGLSEGGFAHEEAYKVVGILKANESVADRLILTSMQSIWDVHQEHEEVENSDEDHKDHEKHHENDHEKTQEKEVQKQDITALLLQYKSPMAAVMLPRMINSISNLQAASPAAEISRLFNLLGVGTDILEYLAVAIMAISLLSMFIVLYNSLQDRQYDLAVMRALGASATKIFLLILSEGFLLAFLGSLCGLALAYGALAIFSNDYSSTTSETLNAWIWLEEETYLIVFTWFIGLFAALIPAVKAYKLDVSTILAKS